MIGFLMTAAGIAGLIGIVLIHKGVNNVPLPNPPALQSQKGEQK